MADGKRNSSTHGPYEVVKFYNTVAAIVTYYDTYRSPDLVPATASQPSWVVIMQQRTSMLASEERACFR